MTDLIGPAGAQGDFHAFARLNDEMAQLAVEGVERPKLLEGGAGPKGVPVPRLGEGEAVGREPVIIVMLQAVQRGRLICDDKAACFEQVKLLLVGLGVLGLAHDLLLSMAMPRNEETPLGAHR